jgi:hypothetical protein
VARRHAAARAPPRVEEPLHSRVKRPERCAQRCEPRGASWWRRRESNRKSQMTSCSR